MQSKTVEQPAETVTHRSASPSAILVDWQLGAEAPTPVAGHGSADQDGSTAQDGSAGQDGPPRDAHPLDVPQPLVGATVGLDKVNVIASALIAAGGTSATPTGRMAAGNPVPHLEVVAWVSNLAFAKEVWLELWIAEASGRPLHSQTVPLEYRAPAGGGGDLFSVWTPLPGAALVHGSGSTLNYHLYYRVQGVLYTDGLIHTHDVALTATRTGLSGDYRPGN